ncbi:lysozyme inhibitor LprI family protein [Jannaschia marina]|uniref:lysozyme inhibitor LprI family protein n=1 Tax=Jannaschia marina TaxID=2741674 RepID=UPI0015CC6A5E|nr:lysozyme inhibitor LprI family protein [Jannaschia marina]
MTRVLALLLALAAPAAAQPADPAPYRAAFDACAAGEAPRDCIGDTAQVCMEAEEGGYTTLGMTGCTMMEQGLWDEVLNAEWPGHRAAAQAQDEAERPYFDGQFSKADERLLAAQRAWIAFRDADCSAAGASWGSGSMRHIEYAGCSLHHTAERVLDLRALWARN